MADNDKRDDEPSDEPLADGAGASAQGQAAKLAASCDRAMSAVGNMALMAAAMVKVEEAQLHVAFHDAAIADLRAAAASAADEEKRAQIADAIEKVEKERTAAASIVERELAKMRAIIAGLGSA